VYSDFCPVILWAQGDPLSELETTRFQMANDLHRTTGRDDAYLLVHLCSNRLPAWGVVSRSLADALQLIFLGRDSFQSVSPAGRITLTLWFGQRVLALIGCS
jgi:hypothetical protein